MKLTICGGWEQHAFSDLLKKDVILWFAMDTWILVSPFGATLPCGCNLVYSMIPTQSVTTRHMHSLTQRFLVIHSDRNAWWYRDWTLHTLACRMSSARARIHIISWKNIGNERFKTRSECTWNMSNNGLQTVKLQQFEICHTIIMTRLYSH